MIWTELGRSQRDRSLTNFSQAIGFRRERDQTGPASGVFGSARPANALTNGAGPNSAKSGLSADSGRQRPHGAFAGFLGRERTLDNRQNLRYYRDAGAAPRPESVSYERIRP